MVDIQQIISRITGVTKDSKQVKDGYAYFAFAGTKVDGNKYIGNAIKNGAKVIITEKTLDDILGVYLVGQDLQSNMVISDEVQVIQVTNVAHTLNTIAYHFYQLEEASIKFIAITGTDGKTTTANIIQKLIGNFEKCAYLGTNGLYFGEQQIEYTGMTTPFADVLCRNVRQAIDFGCEYFVMEVSSHALALNRIGLIKYDVALFTNLSQDHLDFHPTMEEYYQAKKLLFTKFCQSDATIIINIDDQTGQRLFAELTAKQISEVENGQKIISCALEKTADYQATNVQVKLEGNQFELSKQVDEQLKSIQIASSLIAKFNVYNLMQALICLECLNYDLRSLLVQIEQIQIPGRTEMIKNENQTIIIDYAHTPNAIENVMKFIFEVANNRPITVVTGSAGDRDHSKRPEMGKSAAKYAQRLVLTEDDPRHENVKEICTELKSGIENQICEVFEIYKRVDAIKFAIETGKKDEIICLLGIGAQQVLYYDGFKVPYSERKTVEMIVKENK